MTNSIRAKAAAIEGAAHVRAAPAKSRGKAFVSLLHK